MQVDRSQEQNNDNNEKARSKEGTATSYHLYKILKATKKCCLLFRYMPMEQKQGEPRNTNSPSHEGGKILMQEGHP